jgi:trehalose 6-phosphate synthase
VLRALPGYEDLLRSLLAYNLVGLQTEQDRLAFLGAVKDLKLDLTRKRNALEVGRHRIRTGVFPVGVDVEEVAAMAAKGRTTKQNKQLLASMIDKRSMIIGADRLDYSKGLGQRFRAFEQFLARYPANWGKVEYLQIAAPSRSDVPEYAAIRRQLNAIAGQINARYGDYYWTPLRYLNKGYARATMMGFLSISRVGLVTPLRDGMNLVAKEFVAAQPPEDPGALVLSRMAGAALELKDAILVNPYDIDSVADAIQMGLSMSLRERKRRWRVMMEVLRSNNIQNWFTSFLRSLEGTRMGAAAPRKSAGSAR